MTIGMHVAALAAHVPTDAPAAQQASIVPIHVIENVQQRVVKLTGAAVGTQKGYGSGVLVSTDGLIVTAASPLLEASTVVVTLWDGRDVDAKLVRRDDLLQLALLKIEASGLPSFELADLPEPVAGQLAIAAGNAFKVAEGAEPVSITVGVLSGKARLAARYRRQSVRYRGDVLLTDAIVSAPGMAGGALCDAHGELLGVIGRPVKSERTNTWLNYAVPREQVRQFMQQTRATSQQADEESLVSAGAAGERVLNRIGIRLFDVGGRWRPAYVERVRADSAAAIAGVEPEDLLLSVADVNVASCEDVREALGQAPDSDRLKLVVKRGELIHEYEIAVQPDDRAADTENAQ